MAEDIGVSLQKLKSTKIRADRGYEAIRMNLATINLLNLGIMTKCEDKNYFLVARLKGQVADDVKFFLEHGGTAVTNPKKQWPGLRLVRVKRFKNWIKRKSSRYELRVIC